MIRRDSRPSGRGLRRAALGLAFLTASCGANVNLAPPIGGGAPPEGQPGHVTGFLGAVVADEPQAALVGRQALSAGGTAADAAVAVAATLAVTLPSRAGLGGGGACLAYAPKPGSINKGVPEAIIFVPLAPAEPPPPGTADRPAALPMMLRGLYLLHDRYGHLPFELMLAPAENLARGGAVVSRAFADDLHLVAGPLLADPQARAEFAPGGRLLQAGDRFVQPALAGTLGQLRQVGVGDFYQGGLARRIVEASRLAGGPLTLNQLWNALPSRAQAIDLDGGGSIDVAFLPPPADGGLAAAAAFLALKANPADVQQAAARADQVAMAWRTSGGNPTALLSAQAPAGTLPPLGATTTFVTMDHEGDAVACALTMDNLFGTGRIAPALGFLLAASPRSVPPPLLAAAIAYDRARHAFIAAVGGSGQNAAALATAETMQRALARRSQLPPPPTEPGRANLILCAGGVPGAPKSCAWSTDPRGAGMAVGGG
ncbi:MAG TPA: gamma-glutamyltransferase [Acetobacteraceae bacterium]|nr:gamma-glutamyltransferase [Acetobacteraceae bacterium]